MRAFYLILFVVGLCFIHGTEGYCAPKGRGLNFEQRVQEAGESHSVTNFPASLKSEIELISVPASPLQKSVEKRDSPDTLIPGDPRLSAVLLSFEKASRDLLNCNFLRFNLLFPFHHFW